MTDVLFVNHRQPECGVQAMGSRYYRNLQESKRYTCHYIDVDERDEYEFWFEQIRPAAVIWNFYSGDTMPWCSRELIDSYRPRCKQLAIYHELDLSDKQFDLVLHQDPNSPDTFAHWSLPRSIPDYPRRRYHPHSDPTRFGSFGFGIGGKGFSRLVRMVCAEYDVADIHLHIPFAHYGDRDGAGARAHAADARSALTKSGVSLEIDHDFWTEEKLLDWLAGNDCNAFLYDPHYGRGISGTPDYCLAVRRPLAITHSWQFRHLWSIDDSICIDNEDGSPKQTLHDIIARGSAPTDKFRAMWSREAFVASFEAALESIGVMPS